MEIVWLANLVAMYIYFDKNFETHKTSTH